MQLRKVVIAIFLVLYQHFIFNFICNHNDNKTPNKCVYESDLKLLTQLYRKILYWTKKNKKIVIPIISTNSFI